MIGLIVLIENLYIDIILFYNEYNYVYFFSIFFNNLK